VSHIISSDPGLVAAAFSAAGGPSQRKVPAHFARVLAHCTGTREAAMMAPPARGGSDAALHGGAQRTAGGEAPRRALGMLGWPIVMPIWLELDRTGRMSGPSRYAAAAPSG
jgi:hypothetical protein